MAFRIREAWKVLRGYAAAGDSRATSWAPSAGSGTTEVAAAAATVGRRARDAVRNDPYAARIVDIWTWNIIGAGVTTRWPDAEHAAAWRRWSERRECDAERQLDFAGIQALAVRAMVESGECFIRLLPAEVTIDNPVGLRLQVLESDHLDTSRNGVIGGYLTMQGIALDDAGAPIGYWLFRRHPGSWWPGLSGSLVSEMIPAQDVVHLYRRRRPGQLRDVSWLAPVLMQLRDLGDYEGAILMKAKIEACLAALVTEEGDETATGTGAGLLRDAQGRVVEEFQPGMILYRRGAGGIEVVNPSGGGSHAAFARRTLEAASVGTGLTYDQVSGDLTQANYSSLRAGKIEFRRGCEQIQYQTVIPMLIWPVASRFHAHGAMLGLWRGDMPADVTHTPPPQEMIDPLKDTLSLIAQVRAGFVSQAEAVGLFGYDFRQIVGDIMKSNAALDEGGIALDTDPRRVAKSGVAQDAAQIAAVEMAAGGGAPGAGTEGLQ